MKWNEFSFIHGTCFIPSLLHSIRGILHSCLISLQILFHSSTVDFSFNISFLLTPISIPTSFCHGNCFILPWLLSHCAVVAPSCNISFLPAFISMENSFLYGSYFILPYILCHSPLAFNSIKFSFFHGGYFILLVAFISFCHGDPFILMNFCFISLRQPLHIIFHSSWLLLQFHFIFFMVVTSSLLSNTISFLFQFNFIFYGSYFILAWILPHFAPVAPSCNMTFLHGTYLIFPQLLSHSSWLLFQFNIHSKTNFILTHYFQSTYVSNFI